MRSILLFLEFILLYNIYYIYNWIGIGYRWTVLNLTKSYIQKQILCENTDIIHILTIGNFITKLYKVLIANKFAILCVCNTKTT